MSHSIARAILGVTNLLMVPLKTRRRWLVRARTIEKFYQDIPVETDLGLIKFHITNRLSLEIPNKFDAYEPETLEWIRGFPKGAVLWDNDHAAGRGEDVLDIPGAGHEAAAQAFVLFHRGGVVGHHLGIGEDADFSGRVQTYIE